MMPRLLAAIVVLGFLFLSVPGRAAPLRDACAGRTGKWSSLALTPADNIGAALACAAPGFKLTLGDGVYKQVFDVPPGLDGWDIGGSSAAAVKLDGQGGCTVAQNAGGACPTRLAWGKGVVHLSSAGTLHDLEVTGGGTNAEGDHDGQAGVYIDGTAKGTITLRRVMLRANENGVFSNAGASGADIVLERCDFVENGTDGGSHSAYMSGGKSLTLIEVQDYGSRHGNNQKSRIPVVRVSGGYNRSREGRWIECADGCTLTITGGTYVGNDCCRNVFGNGTEFDQQGPRQYELDRLDDLARPAQQLRQCRPLRRQGADAVEQRGGVGGERSWAAVERARAGLGQASWPTAATALYLRR